MKRKSNLRLVTDAQVIDGGRKRRNIVLEFSPAAGDILTVKLSGLRTRYHVPVENILWYAKRCEADRIAREKREARKARKK